MVVKFLHLYLYDVVKLPKNKDVTILQIGRIIFIEYFLYSSTIYLLLMGCVKTKPYCAVKAISVRLEFC